MVLSLSDKTQQILVDKGVISAADLEKAKSLCAREGGKLSAVLIKMKAVPREDLLAGVSLCLDVPPLNLSRFKVDIDTLGLVPKRVASSHKILPVSRIGKYLTVVTSDPENIVAIDDLRSLTGMDISPVLSFEDDIDEAIRRFYEKPADEEMSSIVGDMASGGMEMVEDTSEDASTGDLLKITEEAPVVKLTNLILGRAVKERASDILIEPMEKDSRVRYRIDGVLCERYTPPKKFHKGIISRIKVMSNLNIAERRLPQDGRFRLRIEERKIDFRVSIVPASMGEKAALRILDKEQAMTDLDRLGFKLRDRERIRKASEKPHGMILVCGPTGCGKTTTLYSILRHVDSPGKNLVTVEDPVEYEMKGINQVSINEDIGLGFSACLRSILRQDPDIIMVGEIRDYETVDTAIKSALTGHLVLSTLHTNTAAGSIVRLVNMGVEPFLLSAAVELIVAQRLLRKLCQECREPYLPDEATALRYGLLDKDGSPAKIFKPKGCKRCGETGYQGRVGIAECMLFTPAIKELIFARAEESELELMAREEGMVTLRRNGIENVLDGMTSLEEVLRVTAEERVKRPAANEK
ncbi:MAG: ATPase, T2SS/T4P/T4SS family [Candidatus Omnitrophica bacterium]|nr:ATPase, T2SS/T4P/T4SS family [Candidatus Omnitrophota bacterium]